MVMPIMPTGNNPFTDFLQKVGRAVTASGGVARQTGSAPDMTARGALMRWINSQPITLLSTDERARLFAWLNGEALTDPALIAKVQHSGIGQAALPRAPRSTASPSPAGTVAIPGAGPITPGNAVATPAPQSIPTSTPSSTPSSSTPGGAASASGLQTAGGMGPGGGQGLSQTSAMALTEDPAAAGRYALGQAGMDPYGGGLGAGYFSQLVNPQIQAMQPLFGFAKGGQLAGADPGNIDPNAFAGFLGNYAKGMTTPGGHGLQMGPEMAQQILANPEFMTQLHGVYDKTQMQQLNALQQLRNPSASPLTADYLQTQSQRLANRYNDAALGLGSSGQVGQYGGYFTNFLDQDEQARQLAQRLYGYIPAAR